MRKKVLIPEKRGNSRPESGSYTVDDTEHLHSRKLYPAQKRVSTPETVSNALSDQTYKNLEDDIHPRPEYSFRMAQAKNQTGIDVKVSARDREALITWYRNAKRELPWRRDRDAYRIWVSEVMLQQTTVAAVVPFYERFMARFPTLESLAEATVEDVIEKWAGLGYYSRARNLHRSAQALQESGFPKTYLELLEFPGFGPYTARAVSSLAFDEKTGVLDGNVIRVLSRRYGLSVEWWKPAGRATLQAISDQMALSETPADVNQGLMELGATICTNASPTCLLCPWAKTCVARAQNRTSELPSRKPRREREIWQWTPHILENRGRVYLIENDYAPFLKGHLILPGEVKRLKSAPIRFDYKGTVTHHDIFVDMREKTPRKISREKSNGKWIPVRELEKAVPASLIRKAIQLKLRDTNRE